MPEPSKEALEAVEDKETTHNRFYNAFHTWFMQSGCDFWSECDAPEELASIAVEMSDAFAARAVAAERERCMGALLLVRINLETGRFTMDDVIQCIRSGSQP